MRSCDGSCGDYCCRDLVRTVTKEEKARLEAVTDVPLHFDGEEGDVLWTWDDLPCPFYRGGKCSVYKDRPLLCRMWICHGCAGSVEEQRAHSRQQFKEHRSAANGWIRFQPPRDDVLP